MQAVQEITEWDWEFQPNNIYLLDGDQLLAYIPRSSKTPVYLQHPIRISRSGRKFKELKRNPFKLPTAASKVIRVAGSKGAVYEVDPEAGTCSCPGFTYRGSCKHLQQVDKT